MHLTHLQTGVADKVIVVDPGSLVDADVSAIATRVEGRLVALGTQVLLTRPARSTGTALTEAERAEFANSVDADLMVSIHVDRSESELPNGIATFYYGIRGGCTRTRDDSRRARANRAHHQDRSSGLPRSPPHMGSTALNTNARRPREVGYVSNPSDAKHLGSEAFHDAVAKGPPPPSLTRAPMVVG